MTDPTRVKAIRGWYYGFDTSPRSMTVLDDPAAPKRTGLLNAEGVPLYRVPETVPMGFHHSRAKGDKQ